MKHPSIQMHERIGAEIVCRPTPSSVQSYIDMTVRLVIQGIINADQFDLAFCCVEIAYRKLEISNARGVVS